MSLQSAPCRMSLECTEPGPMPTMKMSKLRSEKNMHKPNGKEEKYPTSFLNPNYDTIFIEAATNHFLKKR